MPVRGIRGAVPVRTNTRPAIAAATRGLLQRMVSLNGVGLSDIAGVILTATPDLNADFPATAIRAGGWRDVPLLCAQEIDVPGSMRSLIRALIFFNTDRPQRDIRHVYLGAAVRLRPDLTSRFALRRIHGPKKNNT
jgi:chorismate mutase